MLYSGHGGAAQEERGAGCSGEEGEKGWAEGKSWAGHSVGLGFVFLSYFLLFYSNSNHSN